MRLMMKRPPQNPHVLDWINKERAKLGWDPIDAIPNGVPRAVINCPIANAFRPRGTADGRLAWVSTGAYTTSICYYRPRRFRPGRKVTKTKIPHPEGVTVWIGFFDLDLSDLDLSKPMSPPLPGEPAALSDHRTHALA